jgi:hypothetical protein
MPTEGVVCLVCAGCKGACAATTLLELLIIDGVSTNVLMEPTCRLSTFRGDATALSKSSAATAMAKAFFIMVVTREDL